MSPQAASDRVASDRAGKAVPLSKQIAWARMQASQHKRMASRYAGQPRVHDLAVKRLAMAEAAVATLEAEQRRRTEPTALSKTGA